MKSPGLLPVFFAVVLVLFLISCPADHGSGSPIDDPADNPNGAWSYGWMNSPGGIFTVFPDLRWGIPEDWPMWYDAAQGDEPSFYKNTDTMPSLNGVPYGESALHSGPAGQYAAVRWTAPEAGTYSVEARFFAGDSAEEEAYVLLDGTEKWSDSTTSDDPIYSGILTVSAGGTVDFVIGTEYDYGSTPISINITKSP